MSHKEDDVLAQAVDVIHVGHQVAPAIATRVEQQHVGRVDVVVVRSQLLRAANGRQREEVERKVGLGFQLVQFAANASDFRTDVFLGLDTAPVTPTCLWASLGFGIREDRLDHQGPSFRGRFEFGRRNGRPGNPRQRGAEQPESTGRCQELTASGARMRRSRRVTAGTATRADR